MSLPPGARSWKYYCFQMVTVRNIFHFRVKKTSYPVTCCCLHGQLCNLLYALGETKVVRWLFLWNLAKPNYIIPIALWLIGLNVHIYSWTTSYLSVNTFQMEFRPPPLPPNELRSHGPIFYTSSRKDFHVKHYPINQPLFFSLLALLEQ